MPHSQYHQYVGSLDAQWFSSAFEQWALRFAVIQTLKYMSTASFWPGSICGCAVTSFSISEMWLGKSLADRQRANKLLSV